MAGRRVRWDLRMKSDTENETIPPVGTPPLPEVDLARVGTDGEVGIAYQEFGNPDDPAIVLVPGLGTQMIYWDEPFCEMLVERGFRVIRMENRDSGASTVLDHLGPPDRRVLFLGLPVGIRYGFDEMADDLVGLLDHLDIERAHFAGSSMGGMLVQAVAIRHPERVASLCSIMARTGRRADAFPAPQQAMALLRPRPLDLEEFIGHVEMLARTLGSTIFPPDPERVRRLATVAWYRGIHQEGTARQLHAVNTQTDRTRALGGIRVPALVIHGADDRLVFPRGGRRTAAAIPKARLRMYEGMAHDLPEQLWPQFAAEIEANAHRQV
jgi:pimeloyl-ACP methyl ester carboxylesterase